jgi:hypothetical protein
MSKDEAVPCAFCGEPSETICEECSAPICQGCSFSQYALCPECQLRDWRVVDE